MREGERINPYTPPVSDIVVSEQGSPGSIGVVIGIIFSLLLTLPIVTTLVVLNPGDRHKVVLLLAALFTPQSVIVMSAWWWSVWGYTLGLFRFLPAVTLQGAVLSVSFIGSFMLILWFDSGMWFESREWIHLSKDDFIFFLAVFGASLFLFVVLGAVVRARVHRRLNSTPKY